MASTRKYSVLAPLSRFPWDGDSFESETFNLRISRYRELPDLKGLEKDLATLDLDVIKGTAYWLSFEYEENEILHQSNLVILFLLALWLSIPTETHVKLIFSSA